MENKISSLVNLNQSLSQKNNKLKDHESKLTTLVQELQRREEEITRSTAVRSKRKSTEIENDSITRSVLVDMSVNAVKSLGDPVHKAEVTSSKKKRVCFESSGTEVVTEAENVVPTGNLVYHDHMCYIT